MTLIIGYATEGGAYVLADSIAVGGSNYSLVEPKVFANGEYIIGYTSSFRMGQLLRYNFEPPPIPPAETDILRHMVVNFIPKVRTVLKDGGFLTIDKGIETGGTFIVGVKNKIFTIHDDLQVLEPLLGYDAIGSGTDYACGAMAMSLRASPQLHPPNRLLVVGECVEKHCSTVKGPFKILVT